MTEPRRMTVIESADPRREGTWVPEAEHDEVLRELVHMRGQRDAATRDTNEAVAQLVSERIERGAAIARAERAERLCVELADTLTYERHKDELPPPKCLTAADCQDVEAMRARVKP